MTQDWLHSANSFFEKHGGVSPTKPTKGCQWRSRTVVMDPEKQFLTEIIESIAQAYDTTGDLERQAKLMGIFKDLDVRLVQGDPIMDVVRHARISLSEIK